jgi:pimeloyl-ACP methyl ester carboxylesterase
VTATPLAPWLTPEGFAAPRAGAVLREASALAEAGRFAIATLSRRRLRRQAPYAARAAVRHATPVVLVPGFLAGDATLAPMAGVLREHGFRTYRSSIHVNAACTLNAAAQLETRLESIVLRRGSRVQVVGHSLGGMLARGLAVRRPDLVAGIVTLGSPMLAPGAHHVSLTKSVEMLVRLSRAGLPGLMSEDCVAGACARQSFEESRHPLPDQVSFTAVYSRRDGIVDWRACIDPLAVAVEVTASHAGLAFDPRVIDVVLAALARHEDDRALHTEADETA